MNNPSLVIFFKRKVNAVIEKQSRTRIIVLFLFRKMKVEGSRFVRWAGLQVRQGLTSNMKKIGCGWSSPGVVRGRPVKLRRVDEYTYGSMSHPWFAIELLGSYPWLAGVGSQPQQARRDI